MRDFTDSNFLTGVDSGVCCELAGLELATLGFEAVIWGVLEPLFMTGGVGAFGGGSLGISGERGETIVSSQLDGFGICASSFTVEIFITGVGRSITDFRTSFRSISTCSRREDI
jgi:hypothetical protein